MAFFITIQAMNKSPKLLKSPLPAATLTQLLGAVIAFSLVYVTYRPLLGMPLPMAALQGACAAFVAWKLDAPRWWLLIHLLFMPLVILCLALNLNPLWYLAAFVLMLLLFWRVDRSRVPLYLSNRQTAQAVLALLPPGPCKMLDAGCGDGALLRHLARRRPDCEFFGIEHAPLTWLWAKLAGLPSANLHIRYGSLWQHDFAPYALVYTFLSPVPMTDLWRKACAEMAAASLLVSNSFNVPEQAVAQVLDVPDTRQTRLYCYKPEK